jgi:hypothetical protein|tara:strand:+ start:3278 stop:3982 length:705 start_codon:yes stop_codon:yes gene_type:complete
LSKKPKKKPYFGEEQENAVRRFLTASTYTQKNEIYRTYLYAPLNTMIESIIRRYKLYRHGMVFEDIHNDTLSFLITKADKFKPAKGKKAYSYFGTICKNYLMGKIIKDQKERNRSISYEDISSSMEQNERYSYVIDGDIEQSTIDVIKKLIDEIERFMLATTLNENETKIGFALIDIFSNYEQVFEHGSSNKFNKNLVLLSLREMTNLTTKEIRSSLKKYRSLYSLLIRDMRED